MDVNLLLVTPYLKGLKWELEPLISTEYKMEVPCNFEPDSKAAIFSGLRYKSLPSTVIFIFSIPFKQGAT